MTKEIVRIDQDLCTLCGECREACVLGIIEVDEEKARVTDPEFCIMCGHCKSICPVNAPELPRLDDAECTPVLSRDQYPAPDQLLSFFRSRRSIRFFKKDPVEKEKLEKIIQAGRFAPTGGNRQLLRFSVIHTPEKVESVRVMALEALVEEGNKISRAVEKLKADGKRLSPAWDLSTIYALRWHQLAREFERGRDMLFYHAPAVIVCRVNPEASTHAGVEAGLAAMQMVLMAEALGLGTCFTGFLDFAVKASPELKKALGVPAHHDAPTSFVLGYPDITFERLAARKPARVTWM